MNGGIHIAEMLFRTNIFALVGGGENPCYPQNEIIVWDDIQKIKIGEVVFPELVFNVRLVPNL